MGEKFIFKKIDHSDIVRMRQIYALRFQVYCYECGFIREEDYPEGIEYDKFDPQSVHFAAIGENGDIVGTMRMILRGDHLFPLEEHCPDVRIDHDALPGVKYAEISRFVISKRVRRRRADGMYYEPQFEDQMGVDEDGEAFLRRCRPMAFGLYKAMYMESKQLGVTHWYSLMEKSLWLLLKIHGFSFTPCGEEVDFSGPVRPYIAKVEQVEKDVAKKFPKFFTYFTSAEEADVPTNKPKFNS